MQERAAAALLQDSPAAGEYLSTLLPPQSIAVPTLKRDCQATLRPAPAGCPAWSVCHRGRVLRGQKSPWEEGACPALPCPAPSTLSGFRDGERGQTSTSKTPKIKARNLITECFEFIRAWPFTTAL